MKNLYESKNLMDMLEERANKRLKRDIKNFIDSIRNNPLFEAIEDRELVPDKEGGENRKLNSFFWIGERDAAGVIEKYFLPKYIEVESKQFMEKVEGIARDIDELRNKIEEE